MALAVVQTMEQNPGCCIICRGTPTDAEGRLRPAIDADMEVNFGDWVYVCIECAEILAMLIGCLSMERSEQLQAMLHDANDHSEKLQEELDRERERMERLINGKRALREIKERRKAREEQEAA